MLEDHPDLGPLAGHVTLVELVELAAGLAVADELTVDRQPTGVDLLEVVDATQKGRLARAARPQHHEHLSRLNLEIDALEHFEAPEALVDALGFDHRSHRATPLRRPSHRARIVARSARVNPRP